MTLPHGWKSLPLSQAADVVMGQSPPGSSYNKSGEGIPFFQGKAEFGPKYPSVRQWTTAATKFAKANDILISVRAPVGPTNIADQDCAIGRGLAAIRAHSELSQEYLIWYLKHVEADIAAKGKGSTFDAISGAELRSIVINLPPLDEQRRIVSTLEDHLSRLDKALAEVDGASRNEVVLKRSILHSAFAKLEGDVLPLGQVSQPRYGKDVPKNMRGDLLEVPVVGSAGVMTYTSKALVEKPCILVGRKGNVGAVQKFEVPCSPVDTAYYLVCPEGVDLDFMYYQLLASDLKSLDSSTAIPSLRREDLEAVSFKKPSIDEQKSVASLIRDKLSELESALAQLGVISTKIATLRRSVLAAAFNGKLIS